jgi:hypothetical protein
MKPRDSQFRGGCLYMAQSKPTGAKSSNSMALERDILFLTEIGTKVVCL